ncbi:outer membrane protein assembly factor BamB family protein [Roseiconus lacunae]|uniref:PQQ-binding-like beta-propeller repeat protein n=1 Tax=Roseiconus lacunae TaxID=2605694 RepID=A0ABT7PFT1_9BACT|nr:PQQ-binding-like beta-propeller repeat protein [Roseiconus lacunae]MCD0461455.1 PQQ-binding-like beta-propeller repeat protein [Roseiconus lacunae]MDM4015354.1 PQQ-binding-like beta-propeller repeat protein [Roseiconus lacunae]
MLANELIDQLERRGLLDQEIIDALREQLKSGGANVTPEAVAKLLVDNGQLTRFQATKLIGELRSDDYPDESAVAAEVVEDDLIEGIDAVEATPVDAFEVEAEPIEVFAEPVAEAISVDDMSTSTPSARSSGDVLGGEFPEEKSSARVRKSVPEKNQWDSFKVYGFLGIIGFLIIVGGALFFLLQRGSADDRIKIANELYDNQNYTAAQDSYVDFLDAFGDGNEYSSLARTRIVMTRLYRAEGNSDPTFATQLAKEVLPPIEAEEGLNEERGNLAALLVKVAENIAAEASDKQETGEKRSLLEALDRQMELTENPNYMTGVLRTTLSGRLKAISEERERVVRDITRNEQLDAAVAEMTQLLGQKKTKEAYDVRFELLRAFPELSDNERLTKLIRQASDIQQGLVETSAKLPELIDPEPESKIKPIVLTARSGDRAPDLRDEVIFFRAKGSVLAFNGEDGTLLWRRYVGDSLAHRPARLDEGEAVLLSESAALAINRCDGRNGKVDWRLQIGESFNQPVVNRDDIYVSAKSGRLLSIDATTGDAKWAQSIPQTLETGPGIDSRHSVLYQPGDHSNLYLLSSNNGESIESYYLGHSQGTIVVPPQPLLGHLFVVENKGSDYCLVHVLSVDETGRSIGKAQDPFRLRGNVLVPPVVAQQRRMVVLTDLGEIAVFDVEPSIETDKVSIVAKLPASFSQPTLTQMAVGRSQMWTTGDRIGRYELQVNRGRVISDWTKDSGDKFFGEPLIIGDALVHARQLRGTSGVRVSAVDPKTGEEFWRNDIGAPVAMLRRVDAGVHAMTTQAALFELDRDAIGSGATRNPIENVGGSGVIMRFENPLPIDEQRSVLLNKASSDGGKRVIVYDPARPNEKIRLVSLNLLSGQPVGTGIAVNKGVFLTLDNGRAVYMDYLTGSQIGSPFQPVSAPGDQVAWTNCIALKDDPTQIVVADSRKGMYRLRVGDRISELTKVQLASEPLGTIAGINGSVILAIAGPASDIIQGRDIVSLKEKFQLSLEGRVIWGPVAAGDQAIVLTDDQTLHGISIDGKPTFSVSVPKGIPVGDPLVQDGQLIVAADSGWVAAIDQASGQLQGITDLRQPFSATPLALGQRLLVPGAEGVVYVIDVPNGGVN